MCLIQTNHLKFSRKYCLCGHLSNETYLNNCQYALYKLYYAINVIYNLTRTSVKLQYYRYIHNVYYWDCAPGDEKVMNVLIIFGN